MRANKLRAIVALVVMCLVLTVPVAHAAIPLLMNHQGVVKHSGAVFPLALRIINKPKFIPGPGAVFYIIKK